MDMRSIVALFLGLVIQFSQVQSCLAAAPARPCATQAHGVCCCDGMRSCPCAKENGRDPKPTPAIPAALDLKWLISNAPGTYSPGASIPPTTDAVTLTESFTESRSGFAGVPLSVAFCRFVI